MCITNSSGDNIYDDLIPLNQGETKHGPNSLWHKKMCYAPLTFPRMEHVGTLQVS